MNKKMLIDASYKEETRVVILDGSTIENYDVENSTKKQLKGNIYLAKIIRIEPSLQAAFVEYGGNRHGFLAFSEIHPDYYQIPVADRDKLLNLNKAKNEIEDNFVDDDNEDSQDTIINDDEEEIEQPIAQLLKNYKIQEVIHRRQILLVQVVKEERGNKGAALTTYLSLAGRYCVLMPNSLRGGGISRKITSISERRRLKDIIQELNIPAHMGMIIRTAGAQCPKPDALKDGEYLLHLWDEIRDRTMKAVAPSLIYEDSSLLKRAIRDTYTSDISEILIDGEDGWNVARDYMRALMPQNMRKLHLWRDQKQALFSHYKVENLIDQMLSPTVQLKSGGYLVINQTEALVAIDVNSGRSIKERDLEETALRTNQEAADEIVRQLRLRDLAGLIVVDFIDMENRKHNYMVEKRLKNALHKDRARIQIGSISSFGLLEMTRQRIRPSISEFSFIPCSHCNGTGIIRSIPSACLHILRQIDEEARKSKPGIMTVHTSSHDIAFYILNQKRSWLLDIEHKYRIQIILEIDTKLASSEVNFAHEVNEDIELEQDNDQDKTETVVQESPFIREIPIQSENNEVVEATDSYQSRRRNNNRRQRNNRRNKPEQSDAVQTVDVPLTQTLPVISIAQHDEQPDISFHPVVNQDEYFASKKEDQPKRSNRYPRQPRWKRNKYTQPDDSIIHELKEENIDAVTIDIISEVAGELPAPISAAEVTISAPISSNSMPVDIHENIAAKPDKIALTSVEQTEINEEATDSRKTTKAKSTNKPRRKSGTTAARGRKKEITETDTVTAESSAVEVTETSLEPTTVIDEKPVKRITRSRKAAVNNTVDTGSNAEKVKTSTRKTSTAKQTKSVKEINKPTDTENVKGVKTEPAIKPIVINDEAPSPAPRAGWWKR